jgi:DNA-binding NtrC family response regulator
MKILIVDDDPQSLSSTSRILEHAKHVVKSVSSGAEALIALETFLPELIVTDVRMPGMSGMQFVEAYQKKGLSIPFVVMTAFGEVQDAVWAMKMGAVDFLLKPFKKQALCDAVDQVSVRNNKSVANSKPMDGNVSLIGSSKTMQKLKMHITQVAATDASVLVLGESGSGKELVSKMIHEQSTRSQQPFVAVNCAAIPENLIESELFGYERGAFSGADHARAGLIESANGGTLMLDEIGDMPLSLQPKLLRVLETQTLRRLGSTQEKKLNVRIIAATHQNLLERVKQGVFRQDLYYRLEVMPLNVPSLKERIEDIPELTQYFLKKYSLEHQKIIQGIDSEAQAMLMNHTWPGNIRELSNVLERAVVLNSSQYIQAPDLPFHLQNKSESEAMNLDADSKITIPLGTSLKEIEDILIQKTLTLTKGDRAQAAKLLGVNERTIYRRINRSKED